MSSRSGSRRPLPEILITIISILVVGILIGYAVVQEKERRGAGPANVVLTFDRDGVTVQDDTYFIPYIITNESSNAIDSADMVIEVLDGGQVVESAAISLVSLPLDGRQEGIYASQYDPATHEIRSRLTSLVFP
jgi:uncharacterized protein (TIGR02588 family)